LELPHPFFKLLSPGPTSFYVLRLLLHPFSVNIERELYNDGFYEFDADPRNSVGSKFPFMDS